MRDLSLFKATLLKSLAIIFLKPKSSKPSISVVVPAPATKMFASNCILHAEMSSRVFLGCASM